MCSPIHGIASQLSAKKQAEVEAELARLNAGGELKKAHGWEGLSNIKLPDINYGWWIFWIFIIFWFFNRGF